MDFTEFINFCFNIKQLADHWTLDFNIDTKNV